MKNGDTKVETSRNKGESRKVEIARTIQSKVRIQRKVGTKIEVEEWYGRNKKNGSRELGIATSLSEEEIRYRKRSNAAVHAVNNKIRSCAILSVPVKVEIQFNSILPPITTISLIYCFVFVFWDRVLLERLLSKSYNSFPRFSIVLKVSASITSNHFPFDNIFFLLSVRVVLFSFFYLFSDSRPFDCLRFFELYVDGF